MQLQNIRATNQWTLVTLIKEAFIKYLDKNGHVQNVTIYNYSSPTTYLNSSMINISPALFFYEFNSMVVVIFDNFKGIYTNIFR